MSLIANFISFASQIHSSSSGTPDLSEIAVNLEKLSVATQEIANAIVDVKKYGSSLEAEGFINRASISLKANALDDAKESLDKAKKLDSSNWAVWVGYIWLFTLKYDISNKANKDIYNNNKKFHSNLEKSIGYTKTSDLISTDTKIILLNSLVKISHNTSNENLKTISIISFVETLTKESSLSYGDIYNIYLSLKRVPVASYCFLPKTESIKKINQSFNDEIKNLVSKTKDINKNSTTVYESLKSDILQITDKWLILNKELNLKFQKQIIDILDKGTHYIEIQKELSGKIKKLPDTTNIITIFCVLLLTIIFSIMTPLSIIKVTMREGIEGLKCVILLPIPTVLLYWSYRLIDSRIYCLKNKLKISNIRKEKLSLEKRVNWAQEQSLNINQMLRKTIE